MNSTLLSSRTNTPYIHSCASVYNPVCTFIWLSYCIYMKLRFLECLYRLKKESSKTVPVHWLPSNVDLSSECSPVCVSWIAHTHQQSTHSSIRSLNHSSIDFPFIHPYINSSNPTQPVQYAYIIDVQPFIHD